MTTAQGGCATQPNGQRSVVIHRTRPNRIAYKEATWLSSKLNAPSTQVKQPDTTKGTRHEPPLPASLFSTNEIFPTDVSWNSLWLSARPSRKSNCSPPADITLSHSIFRITPR